ncbi:MAG: phosphoglycerate mutase [Tissierellia bacterium]|nr:phosphoglycerate mutase [Tissierellia bacterium]
MKTILIILDGASEEKIKELNFMTPIEYGKTPVLDKMIKKGRYSREVFFPENRIPDSLCCILTILGVNESLIPENRAYFEALAANIQIKDTQVVLRCNLVSIIGNRLKSFNGEGLTKAEMKKFSNKVTTKNNLKFYHISDYRNILLMDKEKLKCSLNNMPPHENVGKSMEILAENINNNILKEFFRENKFSSNNIDYGFYPWGVSEKTELKSFFELHKKTCSCVCSAEIVKGISKAMNIELPELKNATSDVDTDLGEKAEAVLRELRTHDFVIAHINGTDEVSHRKDTYGKIKFIEKIDEEFLKVIYKNTKNTKIIVLADHQTSSVTGKHETGLVDVVETITKE